jgi:protein-tyrosine phosphatase
MTTGRIDVHSHLLPGIDDGCKTIEESLACARVLVAEGYTHSFCTPHIWPNLPNNTGPNIAAHVQRLQYALDEAAIPLQLIPGGEINLRADTMETSPDALVSYGLRRKFVLFDLWADELPDFFEPGVRWFQSLGAEVILAHPERMRAVQLNPELADYFDALGLMLQGNLQCLADPPRTNTYVVARKFLTEGRYFMLGSDLHNLETLAIRMQGLRHAKELVGDKEIDRLTKDNPGLLLA